MGGPDLLERETELALADQQLALAARGEGGVLVFEGVPGAGKTTLLRALRASAAQRGFCVLTAVGGELERGFPFGLVRQLYEPRIAAAGADERDRLFAGAAGVAAAVVGGEAAVDDAADATFALLHGLYWVTTALAEEQPLLLLVDDGHWGDPESLRFLEFLGRRAAELRVLVALGVRPGEAGAERALLDALADGPAAHVARPAPLSTAGVAVVLGAVGPDVVAAAAEATGGNPLLTAELARTLADGDAGADVTAAAVREAVPSSVARSVARRLDALPEDARALATALAVLGDGRRVPLLRTVTGLDAPRVGRALDTLAGSGLTVGPSGPMTGPRFAHPLLRSAAAERVLPAERDRLHHAAARALREDDPGGELALHLLASGPLGEDWVVGALRDAAHRALAEGADETALRMLHRAAAEPADRPTRERLGLDTGLAAMRAGSDEARAHLMAAVDAEDPAVSLAAAQHLMTSGLTERDAEAVLSAAMEDALRDLDPVADEAAYDRVGSVLLNSLTSNPGHADRRRAVLLDLHPTAPGVVAHRAYEAAAGTATAAAVVALLDRTMAPDPHASVLELERPRAGWAVLAAITVEAERSDAAIRRAERTLLRRPSRYGRAFVALLRTTWLLAHGSAAAAEAEARQGVDLFRRAGNVVGGDGMQAELASALVLRDDLDGAEAALADVADDEWFTTFWGGGNVWTARAELALARGVPRQALLALAKLDGLLDRYGWQRYPRGAHRALEAEALLAAGEPDRALALAQAEADDQRRRDAPRLAAEALRVAGLASETLHLTGTSDALSCLQDAVTHARRPGGGSTTLARALVDHGAALRRCGQTSAARDVLGDGRTAAARAGAVGLERRAVEELVVAGGRPRRQAAGGAGALTPSERRMAEHAADGLTNRQIAETLFVTRKTVETTLGHAYGKLGIRSRAQLKGALERDTGV